MVKFINMSKEYYDVYLEKSIKSYADELEKSHLVPEGKGAEISKNQYDRLYPQGIDTPNIYFRTIVNENDLRVGLLLYGKKSEKEAFIFDIYIDDEHQNRGYGKAALQLLEVEAKAKGFERIGLHVFGHNKVARHVYEKLGFEITSMQMQKKL